jgi:cytoskeletal protein CcmA (bactofilin family)
MAFGRNRGGIDEPGPEAPSGALTAFIDQGSCFEGKLSFKDTVRIDGRFSGEIASENTLIVGESGEVEATIRSRTVMISGSVVGDVNATRQLVLHKTARLEGNIETASLVIEPGAIFNGQVKMARPDAVARDAAKDSSRLVAVDGGARSDTVKPH